MFRIKIEEEFNPNSEMVGKWFVKYDSEKDTPIFSENEEDAGLFVVGQGENDLLGNLFALSDRFGYRGTPIVKL